MKRIDYLQLISDLFSFQVVQDVEGNEFVLLASSMHQPVYGIADKTEFEAVENHIHIIDNVNPRDIPQLRSVGKVLGQALLKCLERTFPQKQFVVFVSIKAHDSLIIRFHQKWEGEESYYITSDYESSNEVVMSFETR